MQEIEIYSYGFQPGNLDKIRNAVKTFGRLLPLSEKKLSGISPRKHLSVFIIEGLENS